MRGYTHYWYRKPELDAGVFARAVQDCKEIWNWGPIPLAGWNSEGTPEFSENRVAFNGAGMEGHESFVVAIRQAGVHPTDLSHEGKIFVLCKTAKKPYDVCVQHCLIVFQHYFREDFVVSSDGGDDDWAEARKDCQAILRYGEDFRL